MKRLKSFRNILVHMNWKRFIIIVIIIAVVIFSVLLPFIIDELYKVVPSAKFWNVSITADNLLLYYGSLMSAAGTIVLGIVTLHQNQKLQEKSDEVNRLMLEVNKRMLALAEQQYNESKDNEKSKVSADNGNIPKFSAELVNYSGNYCNPVIRITNVSHVIVSALIPIEAKYIGSNGKSIAAANRIEFEKKNLSVNESTAYKPNLPDMRIRSSSSRNIDYYKNITLIIEFSCEDENYKTHYYRGKLHIATTEVFSHEPFTIEKIG